MYFSFDKFDRYEIPEMVLCNPNFEELYVINPDTPPKLSLRFKAISEMTFEIGSVDSYGNEVPYFDLITKNRVIHVENFGYWVINEAPDSSEGFASRKEVHCYSYEYMLTMRNADISAGTYNFYDVSAPDGTLLGKILGRCPSWKIGYVSNELIGKYRTFDMPEDTVHRFLDGDAAEAYEAVFVFDTENLTINAYTASEVVSPTDIIFTWDNLMKSVEIAETDDPVITALDIYGAGNLSIASINPLGTPTIYRFDYFADQMTPALWAKVKAWQDEIDAQIAASDDNSDSESYRGLLAQKLTLSENVITINSEIADGEAMLDSGKQVQDVSTPYTMDESSSNAVVSIKAWIDTLTYEQRRSMVLDATSYPVISFAEPAEDIASYVASVTEKDGGIAQALVNIYLCEKFIAEAIKNKNVVMQEIAALDAQISAKNAELSMAVYFTQEELLELDKFIFGNTYTNEYFVLGENYTFADMQNTARQLYEQGKNALTRISQPNYTFSLEAVNFLFMKEYEHFALQCKLGCTVNAEVREDEWISPILLEMEIDFGDPDNFNMTWGNRYRLQTAEWTWAELNNEVSKTSGTVTANFSDMIKPVRSGELDKFSEFMNSALDTSRNAVLAGTNQAMLIDSHGILGRKEITSGEYEPEQIKILNNGIYLTDDNWLSCAMAIGKVNIGGVDKFGVIADVLVGSMLIGNNLSILSESGNFSVDGGGMSFENISENAKIFMNPSDGFHMQAWDNQNNKYVDKISMSMDGHVVIAGALTSVGNIAGWENKEQSGLERVFGKRVCSAEVTYYSDPDLQVIAGTTDSIKNIVAETENTSGGTTPTIEIVDETGTTIPYYVAEADVYEASDSSYARLGGGQYAFSAGVNQNTAQFSVDYNGNLIANKGTFRGFLDATSGSVGALVAGNDKVLINGDLEITGSYPYVPVTPSGAGLSSTGNYLVTSHSANNFGTVVYNMLDVAVENSSATYRLFYSTGSNTGGSGSGSSSARTINIIRSTSGSVKIRDGVNGSQIGSAETTVGFWYAYSSQSGDTWYQIYARAIPNIDTSAGTTTYTLDTDIQKGWVNLDPSRPTVERIIGAPLA